MWWSVTSHRAYQGFPLDRREELARRFFRWLPPEGFAFVEMINIHEREEPFRGAGFRETTAAANPISEQPTLECCTVHVEADR